MPDFDLLIRGGTIVDGTGESPYEGDVAVRDGVVVAVGDVDGRGHREVDASDQFVTPGFVDIHTHYDGQATWDSALSPSSWNGVTTVVMGNCGVGFAPVRTADHDRLIELMEGVEDIPGTALHEGLTWGWSSFPEYLDELERRPHDVDLGTQMPHAALRLFVMGERAMAHGVASSEEVATMAELAAEAIRHGALGFSTSRTVNHKTVTGELTPSYGVQPSELVEIAKAIGATGRGVLQLITDFDDLPADYRLIEDMLAASGRPLSFSLMQWRDYPERYREILGFLVEVNQRGYDARAQVASRAIGVIHALETTLHPFMMNPVWLAELAGLPVEEQARRMSDPSVRARIIAAQTTEKDPRSTAASRIDRWDVMFELGDPPNYEPKPEDSIDSLARRQGRSPEEVAYDILVSGGGTGLIYQPFTNYAYGSLDVVREMLLHPFTIPGLSDGGAHVGTICDASFVTNLLSYWTRDRPTDRLDLQFAVAQQTRATARAVELFDRGLVAPGYKADLNVIDMSTLLAHRPEIRSDLPAGGRRLVQRVDGISHTFVSGVATYEHGSSTGQFPGRVIRGRQQPRSGK